jgi:hypothetical protein
MLYGGLDEIRHRFSGHAVLVRAAGSLPSLPGVERVEAHNAAARLTLSPSTSPQDVRRALVSQNVLVEQFEEIEDPYLRERKADVVQVVERILADVRPCPAIP